MKHTSTAHTKGYDVGLFDRMADVEDRSFWLRARNRLIVHLVSEMTNQGDRLLEGGCGTGYVLGALVRTCKPTATRSDAFGDGLEHARRRVPGAEFIEGDARELSYDRSFDLMAAFDVLEHIDDDIGVLHGLHRAVRPRGSLLVTVPQHPWLWSAADRGARHVRRYRRPELVRRVEDAGFSHRNSRGDCDVVADLVLPAPINGLFERILALELMAIKRGVDLPMGGSLVLVARRTE